MIKTLSTKACTWRFPKQPIQIFVCVPFYLFNWGLKPNRNKNRHMDIKKRFVELWKFQFSRQTRQTTIVCCKNKLHRYMSYVAFKTLHKLSLTIIYLKKKTTTKKNRRRIMNLKGFYVSVWRGHYVLRVTHDRVTCQN